MAGTVRLATHSAEETIALGQRIGGMLSPGDVVCMTGDLAAGKTTLTKGIARALGVTDTVTSPTFCLVSEYDGSVMPLYHIDAYRLDGPEDFANLGVDDLLYGAGVTVIEWSERIEPEIPRRAIRLSIQAADDGSRTVTLTNWSHGDLA